MGGRRRPAVRKKKPHFYPGPRRPFVRPATAGPLHSSSSSSAFCPAMSAVLEPGKEKKAFFFSFSR